MEDMRQTGVYVCTHGSSYVVNFYVHTIQSNQTPRGRVPKFTAAPTNSTLMRQRVRHTYFGMLHRFASLTPSPRESEEEEHES